MSYTDGMTTNQCNCLPRQHEEYRQDFRGEWAIAVTTIHHKTCPQWAQWQEEVGD